MREALSTALLVGVLTAGLAAQAQQLPSSPASGFQLNRYEPTAAGEASFMVDSPRFSAGWLSVGLSLNYAHRPLVLASEETSGQLRTLRVLIEHQALGHLDVAGSFCDCATFSASLPVVLMERGGRSSLGSLSTGDSGSMGWLAARAAQAPEPAGGLAPVSGMGVGDPRLGVLVRLYGDPALTAFSASLGGYLWLPMRRLLGTGPSHTGDSDTRAMTRLVLAGSAAPLRWSLTGAFLFRPEAQLSGGLGPVDAPSGSEVQAGVALRYVHPSERFSIGPEAQLATLVRPRGYAFTPLATSLDVLLGASLRLGRTLQLGVAGGLGVQRQPGTPDFRLLVRLSHELSFGGGTQQRIQREDPRPPPSLVMVKEALAAALPAAEPEPEPEPETEPSELTPSEPEPTPIPSEPKPAPTPALSDASAPVHLSAGKLITQQPITFEPSTDTLRAESLPVLEALARTLVENAWIKRVRIEGHTDNRGAAELNTRLSRQRAESVKRWLQEHGIASERLESEGYGSSRPIADTTTALGQSINRRVELVILDPPPATPVDSKP